MLPKHPTITHRGPKNHLVLKCPQVLLLKSPALLILQMPASAGTLSWCSRPPLSLSNRPTPATLPLAWGLPEAVLL